MKVTIEGTPEDIKKALQTISGGEERNGIFISPEGSLYQRKNPSDHN